MRSFILSCTIELRLGQDAPTDTKSILPIADIKGRDGWMMGHLAEDKQRVIWVSDTMFHTVHDPCPVLFLLSPVQLCRTCSCQSEDEASSSETSPPGLGCMAFSAPGNTRNRDSSLCFVQSNMSYITVSSNLRNSLIMNHLSGLLKST